MIFSGKSRSMLLRIFRWLAFLAAVYHVVSIFYPLDESPYWRHMIFAGISIFVMYGLIRRTGYFIGVIALLTIQQYYSHGSYLIQTWQHSRHIHWTSLILLLALAVLLICLLEDLKAAGDKENKG